MPNSSGLVAYCPESSFRIAAEISPLRCPNTSRALEYRNIPPFNPAAIDAKRMGLWRYGAMLPVLGTSRHPVSLGEGWTPLITDTWGGRTVQWKFDTLMPTGSYKDRGVSVMVNWLAAHGADTVIDDSSGNAGASLACYAARANLHAVIYVPDRAPEPKKAQIAIYGAELVEVPGPREMTTRAAEAATQHSRDIAYASHAWHPAFLLGQMTCAWEIWEQMGGDVPEWLIAPAGHGGLLLGIWRGFQHLYNSKIIDRLPRLVAVQAIPYTPLYDAFHGEMESFDLGPRIESIQADGIAISFPARVTTLAKAIRESNGTVVAVTNEEITDAHIRLAEQGIFVEPTSATVAVAIEHLANDLAEDDRVVAILTGHGLKKPPKI